MVRLLLDVPLVTRVAPLSISCDAPVRSILYSWRCFWGKISVALFTLNTAESDMVRFPAMVTMLPSITFMDAEPDSEMLPEIVQFPMRREPDDIVTAPMGQASGGALLEGGDEEAVVWFRKPTMSGKVTNKILKSLKLCFHEWILFI